MLECVDAVVQPRQQYAGGMVFKARHMDLDRVSLTDAVEPTDALFEKIRVGRQIEQHKVAGELEIAALAADFRADHDLRVFFRIGEISGGPIAGDEVHPFMKYRGANAASQSQPCFQTLRGIGQGTDHKRFLAPMLGQPALEPFDSRVETDPVIA